MDVSSLHCHELGVFVLTVIDALLASEVAPLVIECDERKASVLLTGDLVINDFSGFLYEHIGQLLGDCTLSVKAIEELIFESAA